MSHPRVKVIAFGSEILADGGVCLLLARRLQERLGELIDVSELAFGGLDLLPEIQNYHKVLFIDILAKSDPSNPRLTFMDVSEAGVLRHLGGIHFESLHEVVEAGKSLAYNMPAHIHIAAVNIDRDLEFSEEISPGLRADFNRIMTELERLIHS